MGGGIGAISVSVSISISISGGAEGDGEDEEALEAGDACETGDEGAGGWGHGAFDLSGMEKELIRAR